MRIIAGTWKGRVLQGGGTLRPTSDRVKESLFSILGGHLDGLFVDLFAGTGNVGLEAASRGARAILVERAESSFELLEANLEALGHPDSVVAVHRDAQRFVKRAHVVDVFGGTGRSRLGEVLAAPTPS